MKQRWLAPFLAVFSWLSTAYADVVPANLDTLDNSLVWTGQLGERSDRSLIRAASGIWVNASAMAAARYYHTATKLSDGKVLVVGGANNVTAQLYNPASNTWSNTGNLTNTRFSHAAVLLKDGNVLVVGGDDGNNVFLRQSEIYTYTTGTWIPSGALVTARSGLTATLLDSNGKVLVVGGYKDSVYLSQVEIYSAGTWSNAAPITTARAFHTATLLANGKVLIVGGDNNGGTAIDTSELFDPSTSAWARTGSLTIARNRHTATLLTNGNVLITGGNNADGALSSAEIYNVNTGTFSSTGSLITKRYDHTATLLTNGKVLVTGGDNSGSLKSSELYDVSTGMWSDAGNMTTARDGQSATLLNSNKVLIAGGFNHSVAVNSAVSSTELYSPAVAAPIAITDNATNITLNSVTLNGLVNDNAGTTTVSFEFGTNVNYGSIIPGIPVTVNAFTGKKNVTANKVGLACGTAHHYRVKAVNGGGTSYGADKSFTTMICPSTDLRLLLTDGVASISAGATTTYTAAISNVGPGPANNARLKAPVATNLTINSVSCDTAIGGAECPSTNVTAALLQGTGIVIPTLPRTGGMNFKIAATVTSAAANTISYTATLAAPTGVMDINLSNNTAKDINRVPTSLPDFQVSSIALVPQTLFANNAFTAKVTIKNIGAAAGDGGSLIVWPDVSNLQRSSTLAVGIVAANDSKELSFNLTAGTAGNKTLRAEVDKANVTFEADETNNSKDHRYTVDASAADLIVTNISLNPTNPVPNRTFTAYVTVKNQGTASITSVSPFYLDVWTNQVTFVPECQEDNNNSSWVRISELSAGATKVLTIKNLSAGIAGTKTFRAYVDSLCEAIESDDTNNQLTKTYTVR